MAPDIAKGKKETVFIRCRSCDWTTEVQKKPLHCPRCLARTVQSLSRNQFLTLLDAHVVTFCEACALSHTR